MIKKFRSILFVGATLILGFSGSAQAQKLFKSNESLSAKEQSIIPIAGLTAQGKLDRLKPALNAGLEAGLTVNEIKEILVHLYAYCGFPRSIRGLQTFMEVLEERRSRGIQDNTGVEPSPINSGESKYDRGKENLEKLVGRPLNEPQKGYAAFAPIIEIFLKEHLFADIFDRDVLTYAERELVTISVIASIGEAEPMLRSHLSICLTQGYSPKQLNEFVKVMERTVGKKEANDAQLVLNEVLKNK